MPRRHLTPLFMLLLAVVGATFIVARARGVRAAPSAASGQTGVALIAEPAAGVAPFLSMIAAAHHRIDLIMYELTDRRVEQALAGAAGRGVDVRVLLNGGYDGERESTNTAAARFLTSHGVHVRDSPAFFALTHQKTLSIDGRVAVIMTLNFDGRYASTRDFAIRDGQPADVAAIEAVFDADWAGRRIRPSSGSGDLVWSPGAAGTVLGLIDAARRSIDLESEEMHDSSDTRALCQAARRGVDVSIVMTYEHEWAAAFDELRACGAHVRVDHGQAYYIHAKLLEVDGRVALVGSQNLSPTSLDDNRELGIEVRAPSVLAQLSGDFAADAAGAAAW